MTPTAAKPIAATVDTSQRPTNFSQAQLLARTESLLAALSVQQIISFTTVQQIGGGGSAQNGIVV